MARTHVLLACFALHWLHSDARPTDSNTSSYEPQLTEDMMILCFVFIIVPLGLICYLLCPNNDENEIVSTVYSSNSDDQPTLTQKSATI